MKRYALSVGINDYPGTQNDLNGCVNDANDWHDLLSGLPGYSTNVLLTNSDATKLNVVRELSSMVVNAKFGDRIYFSYSGHGSWVPDMNGDEADGRDECIVLHDFEDRGFLTDDEMYTIFQARRTGVRVYVFSDSCFSGTVARFTDLHRFGQAVSRRKPKFMPPSHFLSEAELKAARTVESVRATSSPRPGSLLFSGCDDTEYSYDAFIGKPCGAFTSTAISTYVPGTTMSSWYKRIRQVLPSDNYPQTPQLGASLWQRYWRL